MAFFFDCPIFQTCLTGGLFCFLPAENYPYENNRLHPDTPSIQSQYEDRPLLPPLGGGDRLTDDDRSVCSFDDIHDYVLFLVRSNTIQPLLVSLISLMTPGICPARKAMKHMAPIKFWSWIMSAAISIFMIMPPCKYGGHNQYRCHSSSLKS